MSAAFFLQQTKTWASRMFLALSTILVLFSLAQASLDVASAVVFLRLPGLSEGSPEQAVLYMQLFRTRAALIAVNKYVHPLSSTPRLIPHRPAQSQIASLLVFEQFFFWLELLGKLLSVISLCRHLGVFSLLQSRDCDPCGPDHIHSRYVQATQSCAYLTRISAMCFWAIFVLTTNSPIPYSFALVTNFILLSLTGMVFPCHYSSIVLRTISSREDMEQGTTSKGCTRCGSWLSI